MTEQNAKAPKKEKRAKKGRKLFWLLVIAAVWWFNNYTLRVNNVELTSSKIVSPVRFAVISDLHAAKIGISNKTILSAVESAKPDAVFILGDMYTSGSTPELIDKSVELAADIIRSGYPVYVVTGEHDYDDEYLEALESTGADVMRYDTASVEIKGSRIRIMGIDNVYYTPTFDLNNEFVLDGNCYNILLAHIPNYDKFASFGADLTICADTHGGMAQIPFGGGPFYDSETGTWLPKLLRKDVKVYDKGFFGYDGGTMFITSGIGAYPAPVRFNNRPEVVVMDVKPKG